jgi:adenosine deaminase/aminodeoxyfutalosine deaminase
MSDAAPSAVPTAWLRSLPKAELHLHLEGCVSPETLAELSRRPGRDALTVEQARSLYSYTGFQGFLQAFKTVTDRLRTADDYELITYRMLSALARQGVAHAEVNVSVGVVHYWRRTPFERLFEGMERGRLLGEKDFGVSLYWIFDAVRHFGPEPAAAVFREAARLRRTSASVVAIGIGGDERRGQAALFRDLYREAADAGLRLTAHAGESDGPESIRGAIEIGAERIGHALSAQADGELLRLLAERQLPLEICISSNVRTGCCPSLPGHPVRRYFDAGLMVTLNSDDPEMFASNLEQEYQLAASTFAFSRENLRRLAANSIHASFLPVERKAVLLHRIERSA